jgi:hypothetical protein
MPQCGYCNSTRDKAHHRSFASAWQTYNFGDVHLFPLQSGVACPAFHEHGSTA